MAHFLRDQIIKNITVNENMLKQIYELFLDRQGALRVILGDGNDLRNKTILFNVIRFDDKGYRVFNLEELLKYFHQAREVERIIFTLQTGDSLGSNRQLGVCMELSFDQQNPKGCFLTVTSDDKDWVDASFSSVLDILNKYRNKSWWIRTAWTDLIVQISGIMFGFFISLWFAMKLSPKLSIQNSFVICFFFFFLIFSNTWSYLNKLILNLLNRCFPNVKFYGANKDRIGWLAQGLIVCVIGAVILWGLSLVVSCIGSILSSFVTK